MSELARAKAEGGAPERGSLPHAAGILDEKVTYLPCPACGEAMNRTLYSRQSGLIVDVCPADGFWFDAGEIERAAQFPVLTRTRSPVHAPPRPRDAEVPRLANRPESLLSVLVDLLSEGP